MTMPINSKISTIQTQYGPSSQWEQRQEQFKKTSQRVICAARTLMQNSIADSSKSSSYTGLFHKLIENFAKERRILAEKAKSPSAELFGTLPHATDDDFFTYTPLAGVYAQSNPKVLNQIHEKIQEIPFNGQTFADTVVKTAEVSLNRRFSYEIQILDAKTMNQKFRIVPEIDGPILQKIGEKARAEDPKITNFGLVEKVKTSNPELYAKDRFSSFLDTLERLFPSPQGAHDANYAMNRKSHYVLTTMRTQIGRKMFATTQWLTWLAQTGQADPRDQMLNPKTSPVVLHLPQDVFLHNETMKECAKIFDEILHWDQTKSSVNELKNKMALFRYLFAQSSPFLRGSAAIGEWLEQSMYQALNLSCSYHPEYSKETVDIIAITSLKFSDYLERYHRLVRVPGDSLQEEPSTAINKK